MIKEKLLMTMWICCTIAAILFALVSISNAFLLMAVAGIVTMATGGDDDFDKRYLELIKKHQNLKYEHDRLKQSSLKESREYAEYLSETVELREALLKIYTCDVIAKDNIDIIIQLRGIAANALKEHKGVDLVEKLKGDNHHGKS